MTRPIDTEALKVQFDPAVQPLINFDDARRLPDPRKDSPNRTAVFLPVACPTCGSVRWLRVHDAKKGQNCATCQRSAAGKLGYAAAYAANPDMAVEYARQYRLAHPSKPELEVIMMLESLGVNYAREYVFKGTDGKRYILDFIILRGGSIVGAIEVNGYWHTASEVRQARDQRLALEWGNNPMLILSDDEVVAKENRPALEKVRAFLKELTTPIPGLQ